MKFKVQAIIRCDVRVWRTVEAPGYYEALDLVKDISTGDGNVDYEIISDRETMSINLYRDDL
jgi:hypothetical protein